MIIRIPWGGHRRDLRKVGETIPIRIHVFNGS
jgi:hypothetical protein